MKKPKSKPVVYVPVYRPQLPLWLEQEISQHDRSHVLAAVRTAYYRRLEERIYSVTRDMSLDDLKKLTELL
jgi:hypothetical protein